MSRPSRKTASARGNQDKRWRALLGGWAPQPPGQCERRLHAARNRCRVAAATSWPPSNARPKRPGSDTALMVRPPDAASNATVPTVPPLTAYTKPSPWKACASGTGVPSLWSTKVPRLKWPVCWKASASAPWAQSNTTCEPATDTVLPTSSTKVLFRYLPLWRPVR